jgi:hypothetical protein
MCVRHRASCLGVDGGIRRCSPMRLRRRHSLTRHSLTRHAQTRRALTRQQRMTRCAARHAAAAAAAAQCVVRVSLFCGTNRRVACDTVLHHGCQPAMSAVTLTRAAPRRRPRLLRRLPRRASAARRSQARPLLPRLARCSVAAPEASVPAPAALVAAPLLSLLVLQEALGSRSPHPPPRPLVVGPRLGRSALASSGRARHPCWGLRLRLLRPPSLPLPLRRPRRRLVASRLRPRPHRPPPLRSAAPRSRARAASLDSAGPPPRHCPLRAAARAR